MLQGIGFFIRSLLDTELPAPQELVGEDSRLLAVAEYLEHGTVYERYRGSEWCRMGCAGPMAAMDRTDGVWAWPDILSHYLRVHRVCLPEEFVSHALSGKPVISIPSHPSIDLSIWVTWARRFRNPAVRARIEAARQEADQLANVERESRIAENAKRFGEGDSDCIFVNCGRRALRGLRFCACHLPEMSQDAAFQWQHSYLLRNALNAPT